MTKNDLSQEKLDRLAHTFIFVVRNETFAVNRAAIAIDRELRCNWDDSDNYVMWESIYAILSHSANLSKVFWPAGSASGKLEIVTRCKVMRDIFEVIDDSPLADRRVRNGFEHLDERLHTRLDEVKPAGLIDQWTGKGGPGPEHDGHYILRTFAHDTGVVTIGPDRVELHALIRESDRLYDKWRELEGKEPHHIAFPDHLIR